MVIVRPLVLLLALAAATHANLKVSGRVTFEGHRLPAGRKARVQIWRDLPRAGATPERQVDVGPTGRFAMSALPAGTYWLCAYVDDEQDKAFEINQEISGFATTNPVPLGEGRNAFAATIDLDAVQVLLTTRFQPGEGAAPSRRMLESLRVVPLHPGKGQLLGDAQVTVNGETVALAEQESAFVYAPKPPEEARPRYVIEVTHPVYGRAPRRHAVAPRAFGAIPDAKLVDGRVEWTSPPWANYWHVEARKPDGTVVYNAPARSPLALPDLPAGSVVRVQVGRADVQHPGDLSISFGEVELHVPGAAAATKRAP
jgi:hypothetical protein